MEVFAFVIVLHFVYFFLYKNTQFFLTVGEVPNGFAETDLANGIAMMVASVWPQIVCVVSWPPPSSLSRRFSSGRQRFTLLSGCIIQPERRGLPRWLNIMTCEPIKQLIRNGNEADDDEGDAGANFIAIINPLPKKTNIFCFLRRVIGLKRRRWRDATAVCYCI